MSPQFAQSVDPIILHVLNLLDRINEGQPAVPEEERVRIRLLIDQGEAIAGATPDWELAKYAIVSWIDEVLTDTPWEGNEWWSNNVLEMELFNTRLCNERFYEQAQEASALSNRDALEVYYICVVLGFRGFYVDSDLAGSFAQAYNLPPTLEGWAKQTSLAIRLGQGRPPLASPLREIAGAPPLKSRPLVVWSWLGAAFLTALNILYFAMIFER